MRQEINELSRRSGRRYRQSVCGQAGGRRSRRSNRGYSKSEGGEAEVQEVGKRCHLSIIAKMMAAAALAMEKAST